MNLFVIICAGHISYSVSFFTGFLVNEFGQHLPWPYLTGCEYSIIDSFSQSTFTCSKSTIETLENGVQYVQSCMYNKNTPMAFF